MKPVKTKRPTAREFVSIAAAASALGISETTLKDAKRMGCNAFRPRGSVIESELIPFLKEHEKELAGGGVSLRDKKVAEEIRKLRIKNDRDEGKLVLKSEVVSISNRFASWQAELLTAKLVNEYPSAVAGLDVAQARTYGRRLMANICESTQEMIKALSK